MKADGLLKLAALLERDAENPEGIKFDLAELVSTHESAPSLNCGTAACAIGLWALSGEFEGVNLVPSTISRGEWWPEYRGKTCREAAEKYFDITKDASAWLFLPGYYSGKTTGAEGERKVAARIREFVAKGKGETHELA